MDPRDLEQVRSWILDRGDFDPRAFILSNISVAEAATLSTLFWPEFIEYRGYIFLKLAFTEDGAQSWIAEFKGDRKSVESMLNHIHLWDFFAPATESEYSAISNMAVRMAEMWKCAVRARFPGQEFVVSISDDPEDYGPTLSIHSA
ncbi:hypothetical protein ACWDR1_29255 [Streptosporangium sandarakinum]